MRRCAAFFVVIRRDTEGRLLQAYDEQVTIRQTLPYSPKRFYELLQKDWNLRRGRVELLFKWRLALAGKS